MIIRVDKISGCVPMIYPARQVVRAYCTDDADVKMMTDYAEGSEAVNISNNTTWMRRMDGYWQKVGTQETVFPENTLGMSMTDVVVASILDEIIPDELDGEATAGESEGTI